MHPTRTSIAKMNVGADRPDVRIIMGNDEATLVRSRSLVKAAQGRESG
jgi:hypothetical protein